MPLFVIPIYVTVNTATAQDALASKKALEQLLGQSGMAPMILSGAGVPYTGIVVDNPVAASPLAAGVRR